MTMNPLAEIEEREQLQAECRAHRSVAVAQRQQIEHDIDKLLEALRVEMQRMRAEIKAMKPVVKAACRYREALDSDAPKHDVQQAWMDMIDAVEDYWRKGADPK